MYEYHILSQLNKYEKAGKSFHMPGHKARGDFKKKFPVAPLDVTELSYSDNLQCPSGVISSAQKDIAEILGAEKSYIVTGGSSSGVFAMLYAASKRGNKIIVPRNSHQSVWNACKIFGLEPIIVQGNFIKGILLPPDIQPLEKMMANDKGIVGMIVTSPDYYGNIAPLSTYSTLLKKYSKLLIVDGAHGTHLAFEPEKQGYAGVYADMWVDGVHKSLPTLTQGAVVSLNNENLVADLEEGLSIFRTTSPSYPVMASVEYGIKYVVNNPKVLETAKLAAAEFRVKASNLKLYRSADWTKIVIDFELSGISSHEAEKELEKKNIFPELSDGRYLIFYLSPMITYRDLGKLLSELKTVVNNKNLAGTYVPRQPVPEGERTYSFIYAQKNPYELIPLKDAVGRMCACNTGITPPCIPVAVAGEIITGETVKILLSAKHTYGLVDGKIRVVKR